MTVERPPPDRRCRPARRAQAALAVLAVTVALSGCVAGASSDVTVDMVADERFAPATVTVPAGTTVAWRNVGEHPHTTTSDDGDWDSGRMEVRDVYTHTFDAPGEYAYACELHRDDEMVGVVVVTGEAGP